MLCQNNSRIVAGFLSKAMPPSYSGACGHKQGNGFRFRAESPLGLKRHALSQVQSLRLRM